MFLEHFIKAFWATVIILVVVMCVTSCTTEKYKDLPVHEDAIECVYIGDLESE